MNKASRYRLALFPEGVAPDARMHAMKGDGWRLLATVPAHGEVRKTVMAHLFERAMDTPIQAFGPVDELIE